MAASIDGPTDLYRYYDADDRLLYVGISFSSIVRASQHREQRKGWWTEFVRMEVERFPTRVEAITAERDAIQAERPIHNVVHNSEGVRRYGSRNQYVVQTPPKKFNPWSCMYCGRGCGKSVEDAFIQVDNEDFWWVLCAQCDDNPSPTYWIDASRIADTEAVARWTKHLCEKSWFSWTHWYGMIESHSNIVAAKEHAYGAYEDYRARWSRTA